jgi:site-specific recombinase XerD
MSERDYTFHSSLHQNKKEQINMKNTIEKVNTLMHETLKGFHNWLVVRGMRDETLRGYQMDINQFHKFLSKEINGPIFVSEIGVSQLDAFVDYLTHEREVKPRTVNRKINAISTYFKYLKKNHLITDNPVDDYERVKVSDSERTYLTKEEVEKVIEAVTHPIIHYFVKTMANTGIRVKECIHLTLKDVDLEEGYLYVIDGKGGKNRTVPLNNHLIGELKEYLEKHRPKTDSLYFFALKKTGTVSEQYVNRLLKEAYMKAGIEKHVTSHILRHSFASYLIKNTNVAVIQRLLGHSNIRTTSGYLHIQQDDLKQAVNSLGY